MCVPFLPCRDNFVWKINLMIIWSAWGFYEIQGYLHIVPSPHFKATVTNRSFRASREASEVLAPHSEASL